LHLRILGFLDLNHLSSEAAVGSSMCGVIRGAVHRQGFRITALDLAFRFLVVRDFHAYGDWVLDSPFRQTVEITAGTYSNSDLLSPEMQHYGEV
jgi:hypothetical protein